MELWRIGWHLSRDFTRGWKGCVIISEVTWERQDQDEPLWGKQLPGSATVALRTLILQAPCQTQLPDHA